MVTRVEVTAMTRTLWGALGEVPDRRGLSVPEARENFREDRAGRNL
jgi:hypothetical protein